MLDLNREVSREESPPEDASPDGEEMSESAESTGERIAALERELAESRLEAGSAQEVVEAMRAESADLQARLDAALAQAKSTAAKYRGALLSAAADVPPELVPESEDIDEIDRSFEAAERLLKIARQRLEAEAETAGRAFRAPAGAPVRRAPDLSALSASEKIRLGLERLTEGGGR